MVHVPRSGDGRPYGPELGHGWAWASCPPPPLTCVHAGEHQAQGRHGPVRAVHIHSVHTQLDQRFCVQPGELLGEQEALQAPQDAVVNDRRGGLFTPRQHHPAHLEGRTWELKCRSGAPVAHAPPPPTVGAGPAHLHYRRRELGPGVQRVVLDQVEGGGAHHQHVLLAVRVHAAGNTRRQPSSAARAATVWRCAPSLLSRTLATIPSRRVPAEFPLTPTCDVARVGHML